MQLNSKGEMTFAYQNSFLTADDIEALQEMRPINRTPAEHAQDTEWALFYATHAESIAHTVEREIPMDTSFDADAAHTSPIIAGITYAEHHQAEVDEIQDRHNAEDLWAVTPDLGGFVPSVPVHIRRNRNH